MHPPCPSPCAQVRYSTGLFRSDDDWDADAEVEQEDNSKASGPEDGGEAGESVSGLDEEWVTDDEEEVGRPAVRPGPMPVATLEGGQQRGAAMKALWGGAREAVEEQREAAAEEEEEDGEEEEEEEEQEEEEGEEEEGEEEEEEGDGEGEESEESEWTTEEEYEDDTATAGGIATGLRQGVVGL